MKSFALLLLLAAVVGSIHAASVGPQTSPHDDGMMRDDGKPCQAVEMLWGRCTYNFTVTINALETDSSASTNITGVINIASYSTGRIEGIFQYVAADGSMTILRVSGFANETNVTLVFYGSDGLTPAYIGVGPLTNLTGCVNTSFEGTVYSVSNDTLMVVGDWLATSYVADVNIIATFPSLTAVLTEPTATTTATATNTATSGNLAGTVADYVNNCIRVLSCQCEKSYGLNCDIISLPCLGKAFKNCGVTF
eukprot:Colp12_sorted_trinity150504_noHs@23193